MDQQANSQQNGISHEGTNGEERRVVGSLCKKEQKIRYELEAEIERNLEEEIKDGIYHLALKLHRLYQQRRERETSGDSNRSPNNKTLSEVHISIKMVGETKIEIRETKKQANNKKGSHPQTKNKENSDKRKKFDGAGRIRKERMMKNQVRVRELGWKW